MGARVGTHCARFGNTVRVVQVIANVGQEAGGPSYSVIRLSEVLLQCGTGATVVSLQSRTRRTHSQLLTFPVWNGLSRFGVSPSMSRWLHAQAKSRHVDIIHGHGLWTMPIVYAGRACLGTTALFVLSPRGMMSAWSLRHHAWRKMVLWGLLQRRTLELAACFHATAESEYYDIRRLGFRQPVLLLPNGVDLPELEPRPHDQRRRLLFLGRLHPKKGIDILLRAWFLVERRFPEWNLEIAGPDEGGYLARLKHIASTLSLKRVRFSAPLYGPDKTLAYQRASLFVLPTHSENFGLTVAEAMAAATPVIVTVGAPWGALRDHDAGWWIETGVDALAACLEEALACSPERLSKMGERGRQWMARDFNWDRIGEEHAAAYRWLRDGGTPPSCVRLN